VTAPRPYSAAREYKEIVADFTAAADALFERDRERVEQLARELVRLDEEMVRASERAAMTRFVAELHWEAALEALWVESWMTLRRRPDPDLRADPAELARYDAEVELRSAELQEAVRRRRFGLPRR
jgi:chorismate mutase